MKVNHVKISFKALKEMGCFKDRLIWYKRHGGKPGWKKKLVKANPGFYYWCWDNSIDKFEQYLEHARFMCDGNSWAAAAKKFEK